VFKHEGLLACLVEILGQHVTIITMSDMSDMSEHERHMVWDEVGEALAMIRIISESDDAEVKKGLFKQEGLLACMVEILGQNASDMPWMGWDWHPVVVIKNITDSGDAEVKKGLFKQEGLINALIGMLEGTTGLARKYAADAMRSIADVDDDEVKVGMFHSTGLMTCIENILTGERGDVESVEGVTELASTLLQWQRRDNAAFKAYTIMLKLCSERVVTGTTTNTTNTKTEDAFITTITTIIGYDKDKKMRATPNADDAFAVFLNKDNDVAKYILSFLDTNSPQLRKVAAVVNGAAVN
jgi:hypothetical protein